MVKQFAEKFTPAAVANGRHDLRRGNPARVAKQSDDDTWGFHPVWIILPILAVILVAFIVALPVLYVTRDYAAQHDPTMKVLPGAMLEQLPDRKSTAPSAMKERN